jgi:chromosome segregation ATPase
MEISTTYIYLAGEVLALLMLVVCLLVFFYFRDIKQWQEIVDRIKEKLNELRGLYSEEKSRADIVRDNLTKAQKKIIELQAEIDAFEITTSEFHDEINLLNEQLEGQKERYEAAKAEMEQTNQEIPPLKAEIEEKDREISRQQAHIDEIGEKPSQNGEGASLGEGDSAAPSDQASVGVTENEGAELEGWAQQSTLELDRIRNKNSEQRRIIQDLEAQLRGGDQPEPHDESAKNELQQRQLSESETCINILETELDTMTQRVNELEEQLEQGGNSDSDTSESEPQAAQLTQKLSESETCIGILETELDTMTQRVSDLEKQLEQGGSGGSDEAPESESQVVQLTQKLSESETCINVLEAEVDSMSEKINSLEAELEKTQKAAAPTTSDITHGMDI